MRKRGALSQEVACTFASEAMEKCDNLNRSCKEDRCSQLRSVLQCFKYMRDFHVLAVFEVGDRPRHFDKPMVAAWRQVQLLRRLGEQLRDRFRERHVDFDIPGSHACVCVFSRTEPFRLAFSRSNDGVAGALRLIAWRLLSSAHQILIRYLAYGEPQIDAVHNGSRYLLPILFKHIASIVSAFSIFAAVRIHGRKQDEVRRKYRGALDAGDRYNPVLKWLPQRIKRTTLEFRELIEKEYAPVCERHFARPRIRAAADERGIGCGVVRSAEWRRGHDFCEQSGI